LTRNYREAYGMHASSGILFNHESERRGYEFVSRKITSTVAAIKAGRAHSLHLGNLEAKRDWGYSPDYVEAMWLMLQQPAPDDYVVATGESHQVREFLELAFERAGLRVEDHLVMDERLFRPSEVSDLRGDATKARTVLGWEPRVGFEELVRRMTDADLRQV
jgi:GDPmannose 4,6-dehydratase